MDELSYENFAVWVLLCLYYGSVNEYHGVTLVVLGLTRRSLRRTRTFLI